MPIPTFESQITATKLTAAKKYSPRGSRVRGEFNSEECDALVDFARYRRTEAILKAAERHVAASAPFSFQRLTPRRA